MNPTTEPARTVGVIVGLVTAVLGAAVAFGLPLTQEQTAALLALTGAVAPIVAGLIIRPRVTPNAKVEVAVEAARAEVPPVA